jgi:hypothetical protein
MLCGRLNTSRERGLRSRASCSGFWLSGGVSVMDCLVAHGLRAILDSSPSMAQDKTLAYARNA